MGSPRARGLRLSTTATRRCRRYAASWLRSASVRLENGCSGSFVSDSGLILTNRHCLFSCLSENSSAEENLWRDGMVARHPDDERRCATQQVSVLMETREVTDQVAEAISGLEEAEANEVRKQTLTRLEAACEAEADGELSCEAVSLYNGGQYFIYAYRRYGDVRLVFSPEEGIGAFGGDPDNFNFPRWWASHSMATSIRSPATTGSTRVTTGPSASIRRSFSRP